MCPGLNLDRSHVSGRPPHDGYVTRIIRFSFVDSRPIHRHMGPSILLSVVLLSVLGPINIVSYRYFLSGVPYSLMIFNTLDTLLGRGTLTTHYGVFGVV